MARPTVGDTVRLGGVALARELPEPRILDRGAFDDQMRRRDGELFDPGRRARGCGACQAHFFEQRWRQAAEVRLELGDDRRVPGKAGWRGRQPHS